MDRLVGVFHDFVCGIKNDLAKRFKTVSLKMRYMLWLTVFGVIVGMILMPYLVKFIVYFLIASALLSIVYYWLTTLATYFEDN